MPDVYKGICEVEIRVEARSSEVNDRLTWLFEEINEQFDGVEIHFHHGEFTKE